MQDLLNLSDLAIEFALTRGVVRAVDGVSFRIPRGKIVALVGESGSGKSVIGQAIMGLLPRNARILRGAILFDHDADPATPPIDIAALNPAKAQMRAVRGHNISMVFQEPMTSLSPLHSIGNQVQESLHLHLHLSKTEARERTISMLRLCGFADPERAYSAYPFELSGGMRQRAMIAMALVCHPSLLIADEPTTALDVTIQAHILQLIKDLQGQLHMSVLMITHDLGIVANMADEIVVLNDGKVLEAGTVEDIFRRPGHPYLVALLDTVPRLTTPLGERLKSVRDSAPATIIVRPVPTAAPSRTDTLPLLQVDRLHKNFAQRHSPIYGKEEAAPIRAISDVSFQIRRGECVGLVGESGCGKTTLARMLLRVLRPDAGRIYFDGVDVAGLRGPELQHYRARVQFIFQDPFASLNPRMTILDTLSEPLLIHKLGKSAWRKQRASELMQLVGLDPRFLNRYPHSFSGGQRQRIGIARALALGPDLLICDEPVSALDVSVQAQILNLLKDLQAQLGLTFLFISHNLAVVRYVADHIMVMCQGRLVETARSSEIFDHPTHPYTRALLAAVPEPDLDTPLNFRSLTEASESDPQFWPQPFRLSPASGSRMSVLSPTHSVCVNDASAPTP